MSTTLPIPFSLFLSTQKDVSTDSVLVSFLPLSIVFLLLSGIYFWNNLYQQLLLFASSVTKYTIQIITSYCTHRSRVFFIKDGNQLSAKGNKKVRFTCTAMAQHSGKKNTTAQPSFCHNVYRWSIIHIFLNNPRSSRKK